MPLSTATALIGAFVEIAQVAVEFAQIVLDLAPLRSELLVSAFGVALDLYPQRFDSPSLRMRPLG
jgi:hypothetical protein